jgi:hypothetical protein
VSETNAKPAVKSKKWVSYLIRGLTGLIIAITLIQKFLNPQRPSNYPFYMGIYFLANGALSLREARSAPTKERGPILAALTSIIGGLLVIIAFPLYSQALISADRFSYGFAAVVIVIGLLQAHHAVHMTPHPILKRAHLVFGALEILLGIVIIGFPTDWQADAVALVWIVLVSAYMFYVAYRMRSE